MNLVLGKLFASEEAKQYAHSFTHQLSEDPARGTVLIEENGKMVPVEQLSATFFNHLLDQAHKHAGFPVVDCVIAVPVHFDQLQRQAVLDAAKIAGFNVLSLINSVSAAAFLKTSTEASKLSELANFIIYDAGAGGISASVVTIDPNAVVDGVSARGMTVKALASDSQLGGDLIDDRIAAFLRGKFEAMHPGVEIAPGKAMNKVQIEAARIKRILNANDQVSVSLEDLVDDLSMQIKVKREDLEAFLVDLSPRFCAPIEQVLKTSGLDMSAIQAILMIGGNSRHQFLLKSLKAAFGGEKLSVTLDPDEAVVKGATMFGVKLHPAFMMRPVHFTDIYPAPVEVHYSSLKGSVVGGDLFAIAFDPTDEKRLQLFPAGSALSTRKSLTLKHHDSIVAELQSNGLTLARVIVQDFNKVIEEAGKVNVGLGPVIGAKMRIPVQLTLSGQVNIEAPVAVIEYEKKDEPKKEDKTEKKDEQKDDSKKDDSKKNDKAQEKSQEQDKNQEQNTQNPNESDKNESTDGKGSVKKITKILPLKYQIQSRVPGMTEEAMKAVRAHIDEAKAEEQKKVALATARNDLEQLVYHLQGEASAQWFIDYSSKNEKSNLKSALGKASQLLNDGKKHDKPEPFTKALTELKAIEGAVKDKQREFEGRQAAIDSFNAVIHSATVFVSTTQSTLPEERPQTDAELKDLSEEIHAAQKWLSDLQKKQAGLARHDPPVLLIADMQKKAAELNKHANKLKSKKMPVKPKPVVEEKKESDEVIDETVSETTEQAQQGEKPVEQVDQSQKEPTDQQSQQVDETAQQQQSHNESADKQAPQEEEFFEHDEL